ncbi:OmpA family protein [Neisseria animalis]|uniref:OmpA family protein n=1 Tax=Neisseria animalis TaxID=492 RepID=A0A5P3MPP9_NEIAN|nr:OmpA family protein [Neisseria animalis]QEY23504.1 OmpA family protein [Neisseria animalis]ROW33350.1 OmpA family protein [Neisseria animalis]VEE09092.1 putative outer membrane lipoprotein [Neisseria animalis]
MSDNNDHKEQRLGLWIAGGAAGIATAVTLFLSVWGWETGKIEGSPDYGKAAVAEIADGNAAENGSEATVEETEVMYEGSADADSMGTADAEGADTAADGMDTAVSQDESGAAADGSAVVVENGIVKFYFASGKSDLAAGAQEALQDVIAGVKEGKKAVVSGFHDTTGNQAQNEELSKQRAFAVKNALMGLGVAEEQIELRKPENSEGSGDNAEARRVEVVLE